MGQSGERNFSLRSEVHAKRSSHVLRIIARGIAAARERWTKSLREKGTYHSGQNLASRAWVLDIGRIQRNGDEVHWRQRIYLAPSPAVVEISLLPRMLLQKRKLNVLNGRCSGLGLLVVLAGGGRRE
jgi:hypothetical protein